MKYQGPPKPVTTYREPISNRFERVVFLLCWIVVVLDVAYWRP
jgi:hypothetical protein